MGATPRWTNDDELDVRFYVDAPALAAGQRSNLGAQLEALRLGLSQVETPLGDPEGPMVERFERAGRAARVHDVLNAIGDEHAGVLLAAFGGDALPREVRLRFGDVLGPVVLMLECRGGLKRVDRGASEAAEARLDAAKAAYASARS